MLENYDDVDNKMLMFDDDTDYDYYYHQLLILIFTQDDFLSHIFHYLLLPP